MREDVKEDGDDGWTETVESRGIMDVVEDCYWVVRGDLEIVASARLQYAVVIFVYVSVMFRLSLAGW